MPLRIWLYKTYPDIVAITPTFDPSWPHTWEFPEASEIFQRALIFKGNRGILNHDLRYVQDSDFVFTVFPRTKIL